MIITDHSSSHFKIYFQKQLLNIVLKSSKDGVYFTFSLYFTIYFAQYLKIKLKMVNRTLIESRKS